MRSAALELAAYKIMSLPSRWGYYNNNGGGHAHNRRDAEAVE